VIALTGGELVYFELDNRGQLNEYQERKEISSSVTCLSVGEVPEGRQRSRFLVSEFLLTSISFPIHFSIIL